MAAIAKALEEFHASGGEPLKADWRVVTVRMQREVFEQLREVARDQRIDLHMLCRLVLESAVQELKAA